MAGIERGDAIRRPVDSTLSTRSLHRGGEGVLQTRGEVLAELRQSSPAIAVVVEQRNLGSAQKPLFELLLSMNDQWLSAQSKRAFQPGTVLLVEATPDQQLRALPNPEPAQLNRMMQASLNFWQAHTLPRVHATELPPLPGPEARAQLANDQPALRPLLTWLEQRPALNGRNLAAWVRDFMPLTPPARQPPPPAMPQGLAPLPPNPATPPATGPDAQQPPPGRPTLGGASESGPAPRPGTAPDPRPPVPVQTLIAALRAAQPTPPVLSGPATLPAPTTGPVPTAGPGAPATSVQTTPMPAARPAASSEGPPAATPTGGNTTATGETGADRPALTQRLARLLPELLFRFAPASPLQGQAAAPRALLATPPPTPPAAMPLPVPDATLQPARPEGDWKPLPATNGPSDRLPLEIRLGQWLLLIDDRVRQQPASLQQSLSQQAQRLLGQTGPDYPRPPAPGTTPQPTITNPTAQSTAGRGPEELQPLLQLRNWLEAVQSKTQNNAIQQTLGNLTQGTDGQTVQQLSIPLVWLGPSAWANLEWWQEKKGGEEEDASSGGKRLWRFRLFFELDPLAPLCADLVWEPEYTDLTFWSEDPNTLAFLNSQLDVLEQWTEGLGERSVHTRHGMPRKKTTPEPERFKPLVDVRT